MTELRTTRWARVLGLAILAGVGGCGGPDPAMYRPAMVPLPPPAADRIGYDDRTRTLTLPDPPAQARWMVQVFGEPPTPAGPEHKLADGLKPDNTFVYYQKPGGRVSGSVSVAQIKAARDPSASAIR